MLQRNLDGGVIHQAYRPDIDGLRAIAVLSVVAYHYGATWLPGGFVGVDVFFVISGYLITRQLALDIDGGRFSITEFYNRRIRRIVPALTAVIATCLALGYFMLFPGDYKELGSSAAYSSFGLGNLYFYWNTNYFDQDAELLPLLHTWSLGVEEQFYVLWPLLLFGLMKVFRHQRVRAAAIAVFAIASFFYGIHQLHHDAKAAFYLPFSRAWELAFGALIAFLPAPRNATFSTLLALAGCALIAAGIVLLSVNNVFPGRAALVPVVGAALVIASGGLGNFSSQVLGNPAARFTGLISYSLYLWHWPVLVLFRIYENSAPITPMQGVALFVVSVIISAASWRWIERPFRRKGGALMAIGTGLTAMIALVYAGNLIFRNEGYPTRLPAQIYAMSSLDSMWQWNCPNAIGQLGADQKCNFGRKWDSPGSRVLIWGDSHADHLAPIIEATAKKDSDDSAFLLYPNCPAVLGENVVRRMPMDSSYPEHCRQLQDEAVAMLKSDPGINTVVLSSAWEGLIRAIDSSKSSPPPARRIADELARIIDETQAPGRSFVIITDTPQFKYDPVPCAVRSISGLLRDLCSDEESHISRDSEASRLGHMTDALKAIAIDRPSVTVIDPLQTMCPQGECINEINGEFLYRDSGHFRRNLSEGTLYELGKLLRVDQIFR